MFTNQVGSATTAAATLTVQYGPTVTRNPSSTTVNAGQTATFTAAATGNPAPTVQWQVSTNGGSTYSNISGATSTTLTLTSTTAGQNGYLYRAVFTNSVGSVTTTAATLTVRFAPIVTSEPDQPDGQRRPKRDLHRGRHRQSRRDRPVAGEHQTAATPSPTFPGPPARL